MECEREKGLGTPHLSLNRSRPRAPLPPIPLQVASNVLAGRANDASLALGLGQVLPSLPLRWVWARCSPFLCSPIKTLLDPIRARLVGPKPAHPPLRGPQVGAFYGGALWTALATAILVVVFVVPSLLEKPKAA